MRPTPSNNELGRVIQRTFSADETFFLRVSRRDNKNGDDRIWFHFKYRMIGLGAEDAEKLMGTLLEIDEPIPARMIQEALSTPRPARDRDRRRVSRSGD
jgi:hypothetical protein